MGEIIKFDFSKGRRRPEDNEGENKESEFENADEQSEQKTTHPANQPELPEKGNFQTIQQLFEYYTHKARETNNSESFRSIRSLKYSQESFAQSLEVVATYSDVELVDALTSSTRFDWVKKPAFYNALLDEFDARRKGKNHTSIQENARPLKKGDFQTRQEFSSYCAAKIDISGMSKRLASLALLQYSRQALHEHLKTISDLSDIELVDTLIHSHESDWSKNPAFYNALLYEINNRKKGNWSK